MRSTTDIPMSNAIVNSFNEIYTSYYKKSFFFAKSYVHDDLAAEDIASESLIKLWEKLKTEKIDYIEPLLLTILKNKALDYLKHEEVKRTAFESMVDWHQQELSIRISTLESCDPNEIFSDEVESIIRETLQHVRIKGLFPCGEGAGYAGGIVSAGIDGERCAEAVANYFKL